MTLLEAAELYLLVVGKDGFEAETHRNIELLKELELATGYIDSRGWGLLGFWVELEDVWLEAQANGKQS